MKVRKIVAIAGMCALSLQVQAMQVTDVVAETLGTDTIRVSWSAVAEAAYYEVYQDSVLVLSDITDTSANVDGLERASSYQFFVTACDADRQCSEASSQANGSTLFNPIVELGICDPATDGSAPTVSLRVSDVDTATISWCEVVGADGYNLFLDNEYVATYDASTFSATAVFTGAERYQVAWFGNGNFPAKSAVATTPNEGPVVEPPVVDPLDDDVLAALEFQSSGNSNDIEIYFTRHAEKMTLLEELESGVLVEVCGDSKCAEVLNAKGELRATLLAQLFREAGITDRLTHAFSSHKIRTRQTIEQITLDAGLTGDIDKIPGDGIQEFPVLNNEGTANATELDPEGTSASEQPVIDALLSLPAGSVALVAGHSGTLYDIMSGIGLSDACLSDTVDSCNESRYPINDDVKVKNFGDIWKVTLADGVANFVYRVNLQPAQLSLNELAQ